MNEFALEMNEVGKKFRKGELYDSLRDAVPGLLRKLTRRQRNRVAEDREFWAVQDVSLTVNRGEVLGVIGHNGAGKSTMLKLFSGVLKPTRGKITVRGKLSALIEVGAGFHPDLTGRENIFLNGTILGLSRKEVTRCFDKIVDFSGLSDFIDTPVKRYSTGMYARLGFAVAAHVEPDILIVDEVLSVGDFAFQRKCIERMKEVVEGGAAVVFVSHNLGAVVNLCTKAVLLDHGKVIQRGDPQDVVRGYLTERRATADDQQQDVYVSALNIRGEDGPKVRFEPGDDAWVDVEVTATRPCRGLTLTIYIKSDNGYDVFHTSTERLCHRAFALEAGETFQCSFRITLHLALGAYHFGAHVCRYDADRMYDHAFPLGSIFVASDVDVRGIANLYPEVSFSEQSLRNFDGETSDPVVIDEMRVSG